MSTGRPYQSTLREERALETRLRIRRSARRLFGAHGFAQEINGSKAIDISQLGFRWTALGKVSGKHWWRGCPAFG